MPRLIETESRTDTVVVAINYLLARDGAAGLSLRAIARESGVSTSSLLHHYGSREHLLKVAAHRTGQARVRAIDQRSMVHGLLAFLPIDDDDVVDARAWLAWIELWRSDEILANVIDNARLDERALLAEITGYRLRRDELASLMALVDGLLTALCAPVRPMPLQQARMILRAHAERDLEPGDEQPEQADPAESAGRPGDALRNRTRRWRERAAP